MESQPLTIVTDGPQQAVKTKEGGTIHAGKGEVEEGKGGHGRVQAIHSEMFLLKHVVLSAGSDVNRQRAFGFYSCL